MLHDLIRISRQRPLVALVTGLGPARPGLLAPLLAVARRRLGRGARRLLRPVQLQHQLDQFLLAQTLEVTAAHPDKESANPPSGKGGDPTRAPRLNRAVPTPPG
ncbi:hypothetical protein Maq22A_2p41175 (plasmid) [Methylobacterium aquaticum]|uniref:Uncharacterized protein n=1 Tax=Methylobacterium aquaticum TaxID=270351 RepID=A0A0C6FNS9_9HYPH|nr:hypothetical protein Maq22A_2p41175 [Methylobacterium aquaticum]